MASAEGHRFRLLAGDSARELVGSVAGEAAAVVKLSLFVDAPLADHPLGAWPEEVPAPPLEVLRQPPFGAPVALLAWTAGGVRRPSAGVAVVEEAERELVVLGAVDDGGAEADPPRFDECFERLATALGDVGLGYADVVKSWSWYPSRTPEEAAAAFRAFNEARRPFFASVDFARYPGRYPGNTGVGTLDRRATMSAIAAARGRLVPLENPLQTSAFAYPTERVKTPALFSRGMAVDGDGTGLVFVSGTGSVVGAETAHPGDARRQAEQVLENIDALIAADNLRASGLGATEGGLGTLAVLVVYAVDDAAADATRPVLAERVGEATTVAIVKAPMSRTDLLVEMDGLAVVGLEP